MMKASVNYNYAEDVLRLKIKNTKQQLHNSFVAKNQLCVLMIDAAIARFRQQEHSLYTPLLAREYIRVPVAPRYLSAEFEPRLIPLDLSIADDVLLLEMSAELACNEIHPQRITQGYGRLICGWLSCSTSPEALALHLAKSALQEREGQDTLLRFYDPAVALPLWSLLDNWQQQRLFGPLAAWFSIDGDGQWVQRKGAEQQNIRLSYSLSLSEDNWRDIQFIGIVNRIMCQYRCSYINELRFSEQQVFTRIIPALRRAWEFPFHHPQDLTLYGTHALTISPDFDRHIDLLQALQKGPIESNQTYRARVANFSERQWQRIKEECTQYQYQGEQ
ncbi:DUF4123 domain-containing protein [Klebsiella aerogenes]|uniref:DUF4123 domain-containing protein n=1 Tax=Klebsiella aerogenes TaxID=548 RepID=UPI001BD2D1D9|nr:DUF4123 domain-containing protein [Klebsiella aerogenes]